MLDQDRRPQTKRRRHGYRGFGSPLRREQAGVIHWGRGFTGVGFPGEHGSALLPAADFLSGPVRAEKTRKG